MDYPNDAGKRRIAFWIGMAVVCLYGVLYVAPLGLRPLFVPDESRYAEIPREMVAGGDWTELRQAGLPYYEKPPLGYWLTAASISLLGQNGFAVRLPMALSTGLTAVAVFFLVRRIRGDASRAVLAALVYLSCIEVFGVGTFAVLDSPFTLFVSLSMAAFFLAEKRSGRGKLIWLILSGAACGAAFLTKGFTALVIPALALVAWQLWEGRYRQLLHSWIVPVAAAGLAVLPFALALHSSNPDFWNYFFWTEHVQRFLDPLKGQHRQPWWFFLPVFAVGAIPWIFLLPPIVKEAGRQAKGDSFTRYCVCWFAMPFIFFSLCGGKLPTYILPCFPPFAVVAVDALVESRDNRLLYRCAKTAFSVIALAFLLFPLWLLFSNQNRLRESLFGDYKTIALAVSVLFAAFCLFLASRRFGAESDRMRAVPLFGFSLSGMFLASILFLPGAIEDRKSPSPLLEKAVLSSPSDAFLMADRVTLPSVCWHYGRDDVMFFGEKGELAYGLGHPEAFDRYVPTAQDAGDRLISELERGRPVSVCMRENVFHALNLAVRLPAPSQKHALSQYVWALYLPDGNVRQAGAPDR